MPFAVLQAFDESVRVACASRKRFGLAISHFLKMLLQLGRILLQVSNFLIGFVLGVSTGNNDGPHRVLLFALALANGRQQLARGSKQLFFTQIVKESFFRDATV